MCINKFYEEIIYILIYIEFIQVIYPLMVSASTCTWTISKSLQFPILFSPQVLLYLHLYVLILLEIQYKELRLASFPLNTVPFPASPLQPTLFSFFWSQDLQKGFFKTPSSLLLPNASQRPSPVHILFFTFSLRSLPSWVFPCLSFSSLGFEATFPPPPHDWYSRVQLCPPASAALCTCFPLCPECPLHICL